MKDENRRTATVMAAKITKGFSIVFAAGLLIVLSICLVGCGSKFFDPTQVGRFRPTPAVNVILDSLGVAEEAPEPWEGAQDPRPIDVMVFDTDYVFSSGDIVRIGIFELLQEGVTYTHDYVVSETGRMSIPEVGVVEAAGLTESQLEEEIRRILSPSILKEPSVTVTLLSSQQRTFSILGDGIPAPSRYVIPRYDFRLTDALATAGGISRFNISYIYVARHVTGQEPVPELTEPEGAGLEIIEPEPSEPEIGELEIIKPGVAEPDMSELRGLFGSERTTVPAGSTTPELSVKPQQEMIEIVAPWQGRPSSADRPVIAPSEMATEKEMRELAWPEGFELVTGPKQKQPDLRDVPDFPGEPVGGEQTDEQAVKRDEPGLRSEPMDLDTGGRIEWIYRDGRWIPVRAGEPRPPEAPVRVRPELPVGPLEQKMPPEFVWQQIGTAGVQTRLIRIPADRLLGGDPRYDIVIRPGDTIHVPVDIIGEVAIMGNVNRQGYMNVTGRPMTLKMAIAAAGGLGPLAWPRRCEVIRRIGKEREEIVMVDLDKITMGKQPDFFLKPNDLINVGTHPTARWRAILRNAFRATYGFGFVYDRNFADIDFGAPRPILDWF
jgi:polysaccharide export outer membrane protein